VQVSVSADLIIIACSTVLIEKLTVPQLGKKFHEFH